MKAFIPSEIGLRKATGEDEPFVLELERLATRKLAEAILGRWTPRPGMGETFPDSSWIIQYQGHDVGCFTIHEDYGVVELDQFYIHPDLQGHGIGKYVLDRIVTFASIDHEVVRISLIPEDRAQKFFQNCGFSVSTTSSTRVFLEYSRSQEPPTWVN